MNKLARLPLMWLGGITIILLSIDKFTDASVPLVWAMSPLWLPFVAGCGVAGCVIGIVACLVVAVIGIGAGVIGIITGIITFVCALVLALVLVIAALTIAGTICASAVIILRYMFLPQFQPNNDYGDYGWWARRKAKKAEKAQAEADSVAELLADKANQDAAEDAVAAAR